MENKWSGHRGTRDIPFGPSVEELLTLAFFQPEEACAGCVCDKKTQE